MIQPDSSTQFCMTRQTDFGSDQFAAKSSQQTPCKKLQSLAAEINVQWHLEQAE